MADEKKEKKIISASTGEVLVDPKSEARKKAAAETVAAAKAAKEAEAEKAEEAAAGAEKSAAGKAEEAAAGAEKAAPEKSPKQRATGLRITAAILWALAIAAEVFAILVINRTIYTGDNFSIFLIGAIIVDLALVIIGSQCWKKANHIDPASEKNKVKFWLWNNMGVIISVIAFLPLILIILRNKDMDPKIKRIAGIVAVVALVVAGLASYDWNPVSQESMAEANAQLQNADINTVYWTMFGQKYHIDTDCQALSRSTTLYSGTVNEAIEANRVDLCKFCAKKYGIDLDNPAVIDTGGAAGTDAGSGAAEQAPEDNAPLQEAA